VPARAFAIDRRSRSGRLEPILFTAWESERPAESAVIILVRSALALPAIADELVVRDAAASPRAASVAGETLPLARVAAHVPLAGELIARLFCPERTRAFRQNAAAVVVESLREWVFRKESTRVHPNPHARPSAKRTLLLR